MLPRPVTPVTLESITGVLRRNISHGPVPKNLRDDARRRDGRTPSIGLRQTFDLGPELQVPVRETTAAHRFQRTDGPSQGFFIRLPNSPLINPPRGQRNNG